MSDEGKKPIVKLENTRAATTDAEGNSRARMEALSKGGEKCPDSDVVSLAGTPTTGEK